MSDELIVTNPETLPDADEERFNALEQKIEQSLTGALDAFEEIKRDRLYRARYASFEEYVRERWGQSDRHLRRFLSFFKVKTLLEDVGVSTNGLTERAARELSTGTTPEEQTEIAKDITDQGKKITTHNVAKEKAKRGKGNKSNPVKKTEPDQPATTKSEDPPADKPVEQDQPCKSADQPATPAPAQPVTDQKIEGTALAQPVQQDQPITPVDKPAKPATESKQLQQATELVKQVDARRCAGKEVTTFEMAESLITRPFVSVLLKMLYKFLPKLDRAQVRTGLRKCLLDYDRHKVNQPAPKPGRSKGCVSGPVSRSPPAVGDSQK